MANQPTEIQQLVEAFNNANRTRDEVLHKLEQVLSPMAQVHMDGQTPILWYVKHGAEWVIERMSYEITEIDD